MENKIFDALDNLHVSCIWFRFPSRAFDDIRNCPLGYPRGCRHITPATVSLSLRICVVPLSSLLTGNNLAPMSQWQKHQMRSYHRQPGSNYLMNSPAWLGPPMTRRVCGSQLWPPALFLTVAIRAVALRVARSISVNSSFSVSSAVGSHPALRNPRWLS